MKEEKRDKLLHKTTEKKTKSLINLSNNNINNNTLAYTLDTKNNYQIFFIDLI